MTHHLHIVAHDQVGFVDGLVFSLAPLLPAPLHGQRAQHNGLRRPNGGRPGCRRPILQRRMEQVSDDVDAPATVSSV